MYLALRHTVQFLGAIIAAQILYALVHDGLGLPRRLIGIDALGLAGLLSVVCAVDAVMRRRMK
jgi:uncharacterized membrane protein YdcZ (DUF606 family)